MDLRGGGQVLDRDDSGVLLGRKAGQVLFRGGGQELDRDVSDVFDLGDGMNDEQGGMQSDEPGNLGGLLDKLGGMTDKPGRLLDMEGNYVGNLQLEKKRELAGVSNDLKSLILRNVVITRAGVDR